MFLQTYLLYIRTYPDISSQSLSTIPALMGCFLTNYSELKSMHHEEEEKTQNWMLRTDSNHVPPNISTILQLNLLISIPLAFVNNPSSDGMLPDNWLSSNINASWKKGKKTQNWMLRTDSNHVPPNISTLQPYLLRYICLRIVNDPSSDGMLPNKLLLSNINASWRRGMNAKLKFWGQIQTIFLQK